MKLVIIVLLMATTSFAWNDEKTHPTLSEYAAESFFGADFMTEYVNGIQVKQMIRDGSKLEDTGSPAQFLIGKARSLNHFHNPAKANLAEAGLSDLPIFISNGRSTLLWAQDGPYQESKGWEDWSWQAVRKHYCNYLTAPNKTDKDDNNTKLLTGLGYQMHLIQDMGQPNHVRNDTHILDGASWIMGLETWARKNDENVLEILNTTTIPAVTVDLMPSFTADTSKAPVAKLIDTREYLGTRFPKASFDQGLAEYTNSNFFSESTIFSSEYSANDKHYHPYPKKIETNVQEYIDNLLSLSTVTTEEEFGPFESFIVSKQMTTGEKLNCLAASGPLSKKLYQERGEDKYFYRSFIYDTCFREYAEKLIPASVAYSKAMLNYFYRGTLNVTPTPGDVTFHSAKVTVSNNTPNEAMGPGDVYLVIRYKALTETGSGPVKTLNYSTADYSYKVAKLQNVDLSAPRELTFDFSNDPMPVYFEDISMQLVYRGPLGNESDAVAVSPITPLDGIYTDFTVSLPPSGVYAKTSDNTPNASFNELRVTALTDIPGGLSGGTISLVLEYRTAIGDQFQSVLVNSEPESAASYIIRKEEKNGITTLAQGVPTELVFDLSSSPISVNAMEVDIIILYTDNATSKVTSVGVRNISEPTPVDVYNNTDYNCINSIWHHYDDPEAIAVANVIDINPHTFKNISFLSGPANAGILDATASNTLFAAGPLPPGQMLRLGYILTDYANKYAYSETRTGPIGDPYSHSAAPINMNFTGFGFRNDATMWNSMFAFRGVNMWSGAGPVFINTEYNGTCTWDALNQELGF